jgi:energy-coupling factor transporter ATP-binding protein EcfA2
MLRWKRLQITGCKYIPDMDIPGGSVVVIKGPNGVGKTLLLKLFMRQFEKKHDPDLIAEGRDEAVVRLELEDSDGTTMTITRKQTHKDCIPTVRYSDGRVLDKRIETTLKEVMGGFASDPMRLFSANKNEREAFLRENLPIEFEGEDVRHETGIDGVPDGALSLEKFDGYLAGAETRRSELGDQKRSLEGSIKTMADSLVDTRAETDYSALVAAARKELSSIEESQRARRQFEMDSHSGREKDIRAWMNAEIDRIKSAASDKIAASMADRDVKLSEIETVYGPAIAEKTQEIGSVQQLADQQKKQEGVREQVERHRGDLKTLAGRATEAQHVVERMKAHRQKKLSKLPIPGVEWHGGKILVNGKDLDTELNTSAQNQVLAEIASLAIHSKGLPCMVIDRIESFDENRLKWLCETFPEAGIQVIVTDMQRTAKQLEVEVLV